jgi:glutathione S-transferase
MSGLTLWGRASAFNVQKPLWLLRELGLEFANPQVGGQHGGLDTPEFRALNPHGLIPVLCDGDVVVWESHAVLRYLGARYAPDVLWPADAGERSRVDRWLDWSQSTLQPAFMRLFFGWFRTPEAQRNPVEIKAALEECDRLFARLDAWLDKRPYLAGNDFTLADIPAGTALWRYFEMGVDVPRHANVDAWYARLAQRAAYRDSVMVSFEFMRGRLSLDATP